jgi:hypothetical protein
MKMGTISDAKTEFRQLQILLRKNTWFNKVCDFKQLEKINATSGGSREVRWDYSISKLEFKNIHLKRHLRPSFLTEKIKNNKGASKLILSVACSCDVNADEKVIVDPIHALATKILIKVEHWDDPADKKLSQCCWHLDKHDPKKVTETSHPLYHYEFHGSELAKTEDFNYGDFIIVDAPRLMHPPMEIVLAIDFVLKNYYKFEDHKVLTEQVQYKRYIKNAQLRIWRPYAILFASNYHDFSGSYAIDSTYAQNILHCRA